MPIASKLNSVKAQKYFDLSNEPCFLNFFCIIIFYIMCLKVVPQWNDILIEKWNTVVFKMKRLKDDS